MDENPPTPSAEAVQAARADAKRICDAVFERFVSDPKNDGTYVLRLNEDQTKELFAELEQRIAAVIAPLRARLGKMQRGGSEWCRIAEEALTERDQLRAELAAAREEMKHKVNRCALERLQALLDLLANYPDASVKAWRDAKHAAFPDGQRHVPPALSGGNKVLFARMEEVENALRVVMPMAKGYAAEHDVGRNQEIVRWAENILRDGLAKGNPANPAVPVQPSISFDEKSGRVLLRALRDFDKRCNYNSPVGAHDGATIAVFIGAIEDALAQSQEGGGENDPGPQGSVAPAPRSNPLAAGNDQIVAELCQLLGCTPEMVLHWCRRDATLQSQLDEAVGLLRFAVSYLEEHEDAYAGQSERLRNGINRIRTFLAKLRGGKESTS